MEELSLSEVILQANQSQDIALVPFELGLCPCSPHSFWGRMGVDVQKVQKIIGKMDPLSLENQLKDYRKAKFGCLFVTMFALTIMFPLAGGLLLILVFSSSQNIEKPAEMAILMTYLVVSLAIVITYRYLQHIVSRNMEKHIQQLNEQKYKNFGFQVSPIYTAKPTVKAFFSKDGNPNCCCRLVSHWKIEKI